MDPDKSNVAHYTCFCSAAPLGYDNSLVHGVETGT